MSLRTCRYILLCVLPLSTLTGCELVGLGRIQPRHVEGAWTFRNPGSASTCGVDSVSVQLRNGNRTWGSFFIDGAGRPGGAAGPLLTIGHGRVNPKTGSFKLVFSDHEAPPRRTRQFALEGTFDDSGGAIAHYIRDLPQPECSVRMVGRLAR